MLDLLTLLPLSAVLPSCVSLEYFPVVLAFGFHVIFIFHAVTYSASKFKVHLSILHQADTLSDIFLYLFSKRNSLRIKTETASQGIGFLAR